MKTEWVSNVFGVDPVPWNPEQPDGPMVHHGFVEIYKDSNGKDQSRPQQVSSHRKFWLLTRLLTRLGSQVIRQ